MATNNITLKTSCKSLAGGTTAIAAVQQALTVVVGGAWAVADKLGLYLTDNFTGTQVLVGNGNISGQTPVFFFTFNRKLYALCGSTLFFSAIDRPTAFNDLNGAGNSFVPMSNISANSETVVALSLFQGKLASFARRTITVRTVDADPDAWGDPQILENVGTVSGQSVQRIGEWEDVFLADTGFRSLRARVATDNAEINDLGSPIDKLVTAKLTASTAPQKAAACGVIEPNTNRYWCFLNDTIYVLSYFPSAQIVAWSTYAPTYETLAAGIAAVAGVFSGLVVGSIYSYVNGAGGTLTNGKQVLAAGKYFMATATTGTAADALNPGTVYPVVANAFTPQNFVVLNGKVFTRDADALYAYGGTDGNTYDGAVAQGDTPFLDMQNPAAGKPFQGIDVAQDGAWVVYIGTNIKDATDLALAYNNDGSSYANGRIPINRRGTHIKMRFKTTGNGAAILSKGVTHFGNPNEK